MNRWLSQMQLRWLPVYIAVGSAEWGSTMKPFRCLPWPWLVRRRAQVVLAPYRFVAVLGEGWVRRDNWPQVGQKARLPGGEVVEIAGITIPGRIDFERRSSGLGVSTWDIAIDRCEPA